MEQARIIGVVVATEIVDTMKGIRLLVAQPEDRFGEPQGEPLVVADGLQAGVGQRVQIVYGREACLGLPGKYSPADAAVVQIVDAFDQEDGT